MKYRFAIITCILTAGAAAPACAQRSQPSQATQQSKDTSKAIPIAARPPKGMCRIWLDGVPANQQPAPTDCPTAVKNRPANGRVIFGDDYTSKGDTQKTKMPPIKGFAGVAPTPLVKKP